MMDNTAAAVRGIRLLWEFGAALDRDEYPHVGENGLVTPGPSRSHSPPGAGEFSHVTPSEGGSERPSARQGQGATAGSSASAGAQALILGQPGLSDELRGDLEAVATAYPSLRVRVTPPVVWLSTTIRPIAGLPDRAHLLTRIPIEAGLRSRPGEGIATWAWWDIGIWIGPRHTNYGNGSICSFEPSHGTWRPGDSLVALLDIHSVWVGRNLYLRHFGRWPGDQILHTAHERLAEHQPEELCGCGSLRLYEDCHRPRDLQRNAYDRYREFRARVRDPTRRPIPQLPRQLRGISADAKGLP